MTAFKNHFALIHNVEISCSFNSINKFIEKQLKDKNLLHSLIINHKYLTILNCECKHV